MRENTKSIVSRRGVRWRVIAWSSAAIILMVPLLAMQFTDEVVWGLGDFAIFGALLAGVGVTFELATRKASTTTYRSAVGVALGAAFVLVWVSSAVGVIGAEHNDANLMYVGVLIVGVVGALVARFKPHGMVRALLATALAQLLVAVIALTTGMGSTGPSWPLDIIALTGFFAALWLLSAWLFRKAAR